jgi:hypothetical protein
MRPISHRTARTIATALVAGAAIAPTAMAQQDLRMPDTRDAAERPHSSGQDIRMPDTRDAAAGRGTQDAPVVEFVEVPGPAADGGFAWTDAALGAGTAVGIVLFGAGGALATVRLRRRPVGARS